MLDGGVLETAACGRKVGIFFLKSWSLNTINVVNRIRTNKHSWCQDQEGLGEGSGMGLKGFDIKNIDWRSNMTWFCHSGRKKKMICFQGFAHHLQKRQLSFYVSVFFPCCQFPCYQILQMKSTLASKTLASFRISNLHMKKKKKKKKRNEKKGKTTVMYGRWLGCYVTDKTESKISLVNGC